MGRTMAEKIFATRCLHGSPSPGEIIKAQPDVLLLNDVSGPLAFQQFERMGGRRVRHPDRVILVNDHFAPAKDIESARGLRAMRLFAEQQGIPHFFEVGDGGIEHTLIAQKGFVKPGELIVGGDSHTTTSGAYGAFATGMGSTDLAAALALGWLWFLVPESIRFEFYGARRPYITGKDFILHIIATIGVGGATYMSMEFGGPGIGALNNDERMALCNMAAEAGAKAGMVAPDATTRPFLAERVQGDYTEVHPDPDAHYVATHRFELAAIAPLVARPHSPGNVVPVSEVRGQKVDQVYIGNCANGTMTDLRQAASILRGHRLARGVRMVVVPATQEIYKDALREGLLEVFIDAGAAVSTPTCGACFGGHMGVLDDGEVAVTTTNRNFLGRMGHLGARVFLANAYVAAAAAVAGEIVDPVQVRTPVPA